MTPEMISARVVAERLRWIEQMLRRLQALPLEDEAAFLSDPRNVAAAESYLRRALEALLDLGRHVLAKGFAVGVSEYHQIGEQLVQQGVLSEAEGHLLQTMASYRNRMVHFYHEVTPEELYRICSRQLQDVERVTEALKHWLMRHPERLDRHLG